MGRKYNPAVGRKASAKYYRANEAASKARAAATRAKTKAAAFDHYGNVYACCGESGEPFLTIDHIVPKGAKKSSTERKTLYLWLKQQGYPEGFQTLCWNCNMAKRDNECCPHQLPTAIPRSVHM